MATDKTTLPGLKPIPPTTEKELAGSLQAMQEVLAVQAGQRGNPLDRAVTVRELIDSGMAKELNDNPFDPNAGTGLTDFGPITEAPGDLSTPPAPTGLTATAAFTAIILDWNGTSASAPYGNHAFTEIWRSRDNNLAGATLRATTNAFIYTDEVGYNETYYYWVRYVSTTDVRGAFNNTNGVEATTLSNVSAVMTDLSETLANMPGYSVLTSADSTNAANITTVSNTTSTINGNLNAMYVIKASVESNGSVSAAGMLIGANANSGSNLQSYVQFQADKFAIWSGSTNVAPFIVSSGTVFIDSARIQDGAITNARIANATIQSSKIANAAITTAKIADANITTAKIANAQITTALIADAQITNAKINDLDAIKINAGTIAAARIGANTITADKINVTDLTLEFTAATVSGSTIGSWQSNQMRLLKVADLGTTPGVYHIMCRVFGGSGQVKTLSIVAGDGTYGAGASYELRNDFAYSDGTTPTVPTADQGYAQYHSGQSQYWSAIDRFDSTNEMVQKDFIVRKVSTTSRTLRLFILAQGDGNNRQLSNVQYGVYRFSEI